VFYFGAVCWTSDKGRIPPPLFILFLSCRIFGSHSGSYESFAIFWYIAPCAPYVNRRFRLSYHLHLQGRKSADKETRVQQIVNPLQPASRWFLARLIFYPQDGCDTFLLNGGSHTDHTALYPRRYQHCSKLYFVIRDAIYNLFNRNDIAAPCYRNVCRNILAYKNLPPPPSTAEVRIRADIVPMLTIGNCRGWATFEAFPKIWTMQTQLITRSVL
jgi:hypothetical protein